MSKRLAYMGVALAALIGLIGVYFAVSRGDHGSNEAQALLGTPKLCESYQGVPHRFGDDPYAGMVLVPAAHRFSVGSLEGYPEEHPAAPVSLDAFWMDRTEVTNAQFERFVRATGYKTEAERQGGAAVFSSAFLRQANAPNAWWRFVAGASWRHPEGTGSQVQERMNQPVVSITLADAKAYAAWLGRALPSEAQWEWAARGLKDSEAKSLETNQLEPRAATGQPLANYWQGVFPELNTSEDGFAGRAPVGCFPSNGFGLYDVIGNVWEWTTDVYRGERQQHGNGDPFKGAPFASALSFAIKDNTQVVIKGGSFLCAQNYCTRYRTTARQPQEQNLGTSHVGFRTVAVHSAAKN